MTGVQTCALPILRAYEQENLKAGTHIFYRDSDITITAVPNAGYRVQDWTINGQTTADTAVSKTLSPLQGETTVQVRFVKLVTGITGAASADIRHKGPTGTADGRFRCE